MSTNETTPLTETSHPLPWTNTPTGDDHLVTDANGEIVYVGPDSAELVRLYNAAQAEAEVDHRGQ